MSDSTTKNNDIPTLVYQMCLHGAFICGSFARSLVEGSSDFNDYDLIVPPEKWSIVSLLIPKDTAKLNSFGGIRFKDKHGNTIDVWQGNPFEYLQTCHSNRSSNNYVVDLINKKVFTVHKL